MFGRTISFGGDAQDEERARGFAILRFQLLSIVQKATGLEEGRWDGPGAESFGDRSVDPAELVPEAGKLISADIALAADADPNCRKYLVGAMAHDNVPTEDLNSYLLMVVGAIESWLGRRSDSVRKMASVTGSGVHDQLGDAHVRNRLWDAAEAEYRLALEMARLAPDGREVVGLIKLGDMSRVQSRDQEALQYLHASIRALDLLGPDSDFYDFAAHISTQMRSQLGDFLG